MFHSARLRLTAWYLLIIMLISLSFSLVIYKVLASEVERFARIQRFRIERRLRDGVVDPELFAETKRRIALILIAVNGGILFVSGGLGYILAGRTLQPIQDMLDEQNRFITDASHELRTPLTSLKSSLEVNLRDKHLTLKNAKTLIAESIGEVDKLQSLSDSLLELAYYQKANADAGFEKLSLAEIVKKAIARVEPLLKKNHILIHNQIHEVALEANPYGLCDLLVILLDNAIKYSGRGKTITIASKQADGFVELSVQDQGIGIAEKDLTHIFDRFFRADSVRSGSRGYGLGLSIAKKIADIHHASITVKSQLNKGSIFTVHLPPSFFS
ncbi:HAMP domain-containing histidine kinase [Candidatus Woesebacteria bacterium]|nr:HAMP domain-containing histidine kinase [Candidatus Woesebacteria bacterium]